MSWTAMNSGCRCSNCCCSASAGAHETKSSRSLPPICRPTLPSRPRDSRFRRSRIWVASAVCARVAAQASGDSAAPRGAAGGRRRRRARRWRGRGDAPSPAPMRSRGAWTRVACHSSAGPAVGARRRGSPALARVAGVAAPASWRCPGKLVAAVPNCSSNRSSRHSGRGRAPVSGEAQLPQPRADSVIARRGPTSRRGATPPVRGIPRNLARHGAP